MSRREHTDLYVEFLDDGRVDLVLSGPELTTIAGRDNLLQALKLRLITASGELRRLGHPHYGSRVHELIGEPLTRPNLELLRRHVQATLLAEPRVAKLVKLELSSLPDEPGAVDVYAIVEPDPRALAGPVLELGVILDVG